MLRIYIMIYKFCVLNPNIDIDFSVTAITDVESIISNYCIVKVRDDDVLINILAQDLTFKKEIYNNLTQITKKNISGIDVYKSLIECKFLKEITWIENEACSKMMLCDYSSDSIDEYLKSLL